jgi:hypothetical protein
MEVTTHYSSLDDGEKVGRGTGRMKDRRQKWRHSWRHKRHQKRRQRWIQQWNQHTLSREDSYVRTSSPDYRETGPSHFNDYSSEDVLWLRNHDRLRRFDLPHDSDVLIHTDGLVPYCNVASWQYGIRKLDPVYVPMERLFLDARPIYEWTDEWDEYEKIPELLPSVDVPDRRISLRKIPFGMFTKGFCNYRYRSVLLYVNRTPLLVSFTGTYFKCCFVQYKKLFKVESPMPLRHKLGDFFQRRVRDAIHELHVDPSTSTCSYSTEVESSFSDYGCYFLQQRRDGRFEFVNFMDIEQYNCVRVADLNFAEESEFADFLMRMWARFHGLVDSQQFVVTNEEYEVMCRYQTSHVIFPTFQKYMEFIYQKPKYDIIGWRVAANYTRRFRRRGMFRR